MTTKSRQALLDEIPDLVDYFYNDTLAPHFSRAGGKATGLIPPAFTNWRDEQRAWEETAVLFDQSHHMPELFLSGPDALRLLERLGVNSVANFAADRAKQFIACNRRGQVIGDCIAYRHGANDFELVSGMPVLNWVHFHADTGGYDVTVRRDDHSIANPTGRLVKYRFQLDGPHAGNVFNEVVHATPPQLDFFRTARIAIAGREVLALRHGMAGHQSVELSGPYDDHEVIRSALLDAAYGLKQVGTQAYFSTPLVSAWMAYPLPAIYTDDQMQQYREWLPADTWEASTQIGGSFCSADLEDYYVTPYDLGYGHIVKNDHDFSGRESLEALPTASRRTRMTLVWNHDDVVKVMASQLGKGPRYQGDRSARLLLWIPPLRRGTQSYRSHGRPVMPRRIHQQRRRNAVAGDAGTWLRAGRHRTRTHLGRARRRFQKATRAAPRTNPDSRQRHPIPAASTV